MKKVGLLTVLLTGALLMVGVFDFPAWGDPYSPANRYLSTHYVNQAEKETAVPNLVTAVLADYRSFDTMLETSVVFIAGLAIFAILRSIEGPLVQARKRTESREKRAEKRDAGGDGQDPDLIVQTTVRLLLPTIQLFAFYVVGHGHHSPGGGFQGGVILAAGLILVAMTFGLKNTLKQFSERRGLAFGSLGVLLFAGTGLLCALMGTQFLDYSVLEAVYPFTDEIMARSHSMLVVEIGVALTVMSMLYLIYANLASHGDMKKGL